MPSLRGESEREKEKAWKPDDRVPSGLSLSFHSPHPFFLRLAIRLARGFWVGWGNEHPRTRRDDSSWCRDGSFPELRLARYCASPSTLKGMVVWHPSEGDHEGVGGRCCGFGIWILVTTEGLKGDFGRLACLASVFYHFLVDFLSWR